LLHDDARPHTGRANIEAQETLKIEILADPAYSPDLAPSDFHLFRHLKRKLKGTHFTSDDEVNKAVTSWMKDILNSLVTACAHMYYIGKKLLNKATLSKIRMSNCI
jgi:transposase